MQPSITESLAKEGKYMNQERYTNLIAVLLSTMGLPDTFVEEDGFIYFMKDLKPLYETPSRFVVCFKHKLHK